LEAALLRTVPFAVLAAVVLGTGCTDPNLDARLAAIEAKMETIDKKVEGMAKAPPAAAKPGAAPGAASPEEEQAASALLQAAQKAMEAMEFDEAKAKLAELKSKFGSSRAARAASRLEGELAVVGKPAGDLKVEKWHQGNVASFDGGKATLLVFWEVWCPHCKREVPKVEETFKKYGAKGLQVVGLTKQSRDKTDEDVQAFIKEKNVSYPIAKEDGDLSTRFGVRGVPAAAVVKDGAVVWRGHPARLTDEMLEKWL
jgi:thiol-disulfide isomerase/thioredoxin